MDHAYYLAGIRKEDDEIDFFNLDEGDSYTGNAEEFFEKGELSNKNKY